MIERLDHNGRASRAFQFFADHVQHAKRSTDPLLLLRQRRRTLARHARAHGAQGGTLQRFDRANQYMVQIGKREKSRELVMVPIREHSQLMTQSKRIRSGGERLTQQELREQMKISSRDRSPSLHDVVHCQRTHIKIHLGATRSLLGLRTCGRLPIRWRCLPHNHSTWRP